MWELEKGFRQGKRKKGKKKKEKKSTNYRNLDRQTQRERAGGEGKTAPGI